MYKIQVLSCIILKELLRHGETDLVPEVQVDACTTESVYRFIEEFEDSSLVHLNLFQKGDQEINGSQTKVSISRKYQHNAIWMEDISVKFSKIYRLNTNLQQKICFKYLQKLLVEMLNKTKTRP